MLTRLINKSVVLNRAADYELQAKLRKVKPAPMFDQEVATPPMYGSNLSQCQITNRSLTKTLITTPPTNYHYLKINQFTYGHIHWLHQQ